MNKIPESIDKNPELKPAEDYYRLRREGIGFIEKMASSLWTDYNTHDPGITILEILCYAITDLAYRANWDIKDLLTSEQPLTDPKQPFPNQTFFTAREILTVNPVTLDDFRRVLIDLPEVRNAWVNCACDVSYYVKCQNEQLQLSYQKTEGAEAVQLNGLYEVLVESEVDSESGEINTQKTLNAVKATLHNHRNLDEDFCRITVVSIENIAVCADVEVAPDADIERVQARILFEIENYFNPPVRFYTLDELLEKDIPVETIFNGPALDNGFILDEDLQNAQLKMVLRISDLINRLMDFKDEGIVAVNNLLLSKYDANNKLVGGAADPDIDKDGNPKFAANKTSAAWSLYIQDKHQPRLHRDNSSFVFLKNGLPFKPRKDEVDQTLIQLRGEFERPKISQTDMNLKIPSGTFRNLEDYYPLQDSFPLTYGIGSEGLPAGASPERKAQAKQLKAYLMVFEQLLTNTLAQLANVDKLFSLDFSITRTYFVKELSQSLIQGYDELVNNFNKTTLKNITETSSEFNDRRNRFLNHLMARFGEQFSEYALLLTNYKGQQVALDRLIEDKISFLKAYPLISHDRSKAFNYKEKLCVANNFSVLKKRVSLLLGFPSLEFEWTITETTHGHYKTEFQLKGQNQKLWLVGKFTLPAHDTTTANERAYQELMTQIIQPSAYKLVKKKGHYELKLTDIHHKLMAQAASEFDTNTEALKYKNELIQWGANEHAIIVEHLLLRPKFPGDALYPIYADDACNLCGDEDPYSFRLTFVMPGWTAPYKINMEMRHFADRTIRRETPAHLLVKICWVDNTGFEFNACDPLLAKLANLLKNDSTFHYSDKQAYHCATVIFKKYHETFKLWFNEYKAYPWLKLTWESKITELFKPSEENNINCSKSVSGDTWKNIHTELLAYFIDIALHGWQFERFEAAWCQWLEANAKIDWAEVHLQESVLAVLQANLDSAQSPPTREQLCDCVTNIIGDYAAKFYQWMQTNISNISTGESWKNFFDGDKKLPKLEFKNACSFLSDAAKQQITDLLVGDKGLYTSWVEVSYRLWIVVNLLSELRNTYPGATLHDCDDGNDQNPVRLGSTALGNYPLRSSAT